MKKLTFENGTENFRFCVLLGFLYFLLSSSCLAQVKFVPEAYFYKIDNSDSLVNVQLYDMNGDGTEQLVALYLNRNQSIIRTNIHKLDGELIGNRVFSFNKYDKFINGSLIRCNNKNYLAAVFITSKDSIFYDPVYKYNISFLKYYQAIKIIDFETGKVIDSSLIHFYTNQLNYTLYHTAYLKTKVNFVNAVPTGSGVNLLIGLEDSTAINYDAIAYFTTKSKLLKIFFNGYGLNYANIIEGCGNGIYTHNDTYYSDGLIVNSTGGTYMNDISNAGIFKIFMPDSTKIIIDTLFFKDGYVTKGKYGGRGYSKFMSCFTVLYNNLPVNKLNSPLVYFHSSDSQLQEWNGARFVNLKNEMREIDKSVYGELNNNTFHPVYSNFYLKDSTAAVIYFSKDGPYITLWVRDISDGHLLYSDSYASFVPTAILKSRQKDDLLFVKQNNNGGVLYRIDWERLLTDIKEENEGFVAGGFTLYQNYPNPFNPSTTLSFNISKPSFVKLQVFNLLGQCISTLVNEDRNAGLHKINYNAADLAGGVYFCKITVNGYTQTKKILLVK